MHALEGTRLHLCSELRALKLISNVDVLRTYNHIYIHVLAESFVHAIKLMSCKFDKPVLDHSSVKDVRLADKVSDKCVLRLVIDICRCSYLPDVTVIEHDDGIRKGQCLLLVMSHINEGDSELAVHFLEFDLHVLSHLEVQGRQRLIQKKHLRLIDNRSCNGHALLLTTGKRLHISVLIVGHAHHLEHLADSLVNLLLRNLLKFEAERNVLIHIKMREESITLEHCIDRTLMRRHISNVSTVDKDFTRICRSETRNHTQKRRLATARRSEQGKELALLDRNVDIVENAFFAEALADILDFNYVFAAFHFQRMSLFVSKFVEQCLSCACQVKFPRQTDIDIIWIILII